MVLNVTFTMNDILQQTFSSVFKNAVFLNY